MNVIEGIELLNIADLRFSPDRKWKIITHIFRENLPIDKYDKLIQQSVLFLKLYNIDPIQAKRRFKTIAFCHDLRFSSSPRYHLLEAFILTGQVDKKIAKDFGIRQYELKMYKKLFFDISNMLKSEIAILASVFIQVLKFPRLIESNPEYIWKLIGYYGGYEILKEYLRFGSMSPKTQDYNEKAIYADFLRKSLLSARLLKPTQYYATDILSSFVKLLGSGKETETGEEELKRVFRDALSQAGISLHEYDTKLNEFEVPSINRSRVSVWGIN